MNPTPNPSIHRFASFLLFLSGSAALAHQTLWTRRLVDILGASSNTFSQVIGAFFIGLALGSGYAAWTRKRSCPSWRKVALAELAVALLALVPLLSIYTLESIQTLASFGPSWRGWLALLLITPPAFAMGLVLPWTLDVLALQSFARTNDPTHEEGNQAHSSIRLYSINTLGGMVGIALVSLFAIAQLGLQGTGLAAIFLNLIVAAGFWRLHSSNPPTSTHSTPLSPALAPTEFSPFQSLTLSFASGFLVLALEVILQHQFAQITINSFFSSATILVIVLTGLGLGGLILPRLTHSGRSIHDLLRLGLLTAAIACIAQPWVFRALHPGVQNLPYSWPALLYFFAVLTIGIVVALPVFLTSGMVFPSLLGSNPRRLALLLCLNGIGGWLGAELAQHWIIRHGGLWLSMVWIGIAYSLLLAIAIRRFLPTTALIALAVAVSLPTQRLPQVAIRKNETPVEIKVGHEGVVATVQSDKNDFRIIFNNTYTLGGSKAQPHQERQGLLPLLLHGNPKRVALLGVATGSTTAGTALCPTVNHIEAIELSSIVLQFAQSHFAPFNRNIFSDPRAHFIHEDARWVMAAKSSQYDVVIGDLFLPWRTGEGRLFTLEHFKSVKRSLNPDGLYCQWLPMFQLTQAQFDTICRTFQSAFPNTFVVRGDFFTEFPILGLVGTADDRGLPQLHWNQIESLCSRIRDINAVKDPLLRHPEGVAMQIIGPLPPSTHGPINTLANGWLEWDAGRNIIGLQSPWFIGVPCAEFIRSLHQQGQRIVPAPLLSAHDSGQFLLTLEIAAKVLSPIVTNLQAQLPDRLPQPLTQDTNADWSQWPMRHPIRKSTQP